MKNLTKKRGFFAAAAALLAVTVMLVTTWCSNVISGNNADEFTPPAGKGAVKLSFNDKIARTILPDDATIASFGEFDFVFTPSVGPAITKTVLYANRNTPITLDPGTYDLQVIGKLDIDPTAGTNYQPAAINNPAVQVIITPAHVTNATIVLKPYEQTVGTGNGTFNYKILSSILLDDINTAVMNLTSIYAGTTQPSENIKTVWNDSVTGGTLAVKAGNYYLDFVITVKTGDVITFRHIINIYQNMTSSYEFTINPGYFNAAFQLIAGQPTYKHPEDNLPLLSYNHGNKNINLVENNTVEVNLGDSVTIAVTNASAGGYTAYEWFSLNTTPLGTAVSYPVNTAAAPFNEKRTYQLTVVGVVSADEKYYTFINIKVTDKVITGLADDTWANGTLAANGTQWFSFEALNTTQYIHVDTIDPTLTGGIDILVYESNGTTPVGSLETLPSSGDYYFVIPSLTPTNTYYIKVMTNTSGDNGAYKIGFTGSTTPPQN